MKVTLSFVGKQVSFNVVLLILGSSLSAEGTACDQPFEGFGVFLGSAGHFSNSTPGTVQKVIDQVYHDLAIRHYRTSYESIFSQTNHSYDISCMNNFTCSWIEIQETISRYPNITLFASVWSPPHYMKNQVFDTLLEEYEQPYYYFIKNITSLMKSKFNLTVEKVSPINEPENLFAPWEHTNMGPYQMCRMVDSFNDPLIALCPENSYYWMTELYSNYSDNATGVSCQSTCEIYATHAYELNIDFFSPNHLLAYYDLGKYFKKTDKPIWMTEVSSTFEEADLNQMQEGFDMATNIINFLGTTCVQRYYFWYMYTQGYSGESLIWGYDEVTGQLNLPKKYFFYKHFTHASFGGPKIVSECIDHSNSSDSSGNNDGNDFYNSNGNESTGIDKVFCLRFGDGNVVLVNKDFNPYALSGFQCKTPLCCTTEEFDWFCIIEFFDVILPKRSICSCEIFNSQGTLPNPLVTKINSTIFDNEIPQV